MVVEINNFLVAKIDRSKGAEIYQNRNLSEALAKNLLIHALPNGNPEANVVKLTTLDERIFLTYLKLRNNEDSGMALILEVDEQILQRNPLGYTKSMENIVSSLLTKDKELEQVDISYQQPDFLNGDYKKLDTVVFNLLTRQKTFLVGERERAFQFIAKVLECVPQELQIYLPFIIQSSSLNEEATLISLPFREEIMKTLDKNKGEFTVLFLPTREAYGLYTSPFCEHIANLFEKNELQEIKQLIKKYYDLAVQTETIIPPADFAEQKKIPVADAILIQWMRANHYEKEFDRGFLDTLD